MALKLEIRPEEMDAAETVMRNQLSIFEEEIAKIQNQVHSDLAACNGSLYEMLKESYDSEIQTILNRTRENVEIYIQKMKMASDELGDTTDRIAGIFGN